MDTVKSKMVNFIAINIPGTASLICHSKKVRYCYFLDTDLLVIILLLAIIIICYCYTKLKGINALQYKL